MPARLKRNKRRHSAQITPEAIELFRRGLDTSDPYVLLDIKIRLAAALGRSKFSANPLDREPRSLIGQNAPVEHDLRRMLLTEIGEADEHGLSIRMRSPKQS